MSISIYSGSSAETACPEKSVSLVIKGDRHGFDVTEAIQIMENSLEQFRVQAHICSEQRFGRMDFKMTRSMLAAESCEQSANLMVSGLAGMSYLT